MEREAQMFHLSIELFWIGFVSFRILVQVAESLSVFFYSSFEFAGLERFVAKVFEVRSNLKVFGTFQVLPLIVVTCLVKGVKSLM